MKFFPMITIILSASLLLCACAPAASTQPTTPEAHGQTEPMPLPPVQEQALTFEAQYIRTNGYHDDILYPVVTLIRSREELDRYYEENKSLYQLERREDPENPGFLDACGKYTDDYFEDHILLLVLLQEGSGSFRHQVDSLIMTAEGTLTAQIQTLTPPGGFGTCDMAQWHILIEPEAGISVESEADIQIYWDDKLVYNGHAHELADQPQLNGEPTEGYCGNTMTVIRIDGEEYPFTGTPSVTLTDLLRHLDYSPHKVCKCLPEFKVETEFGSYGIHLGQGYARCEAGQVALTREQVATIRHILDTIRAEDITEEDAAVLAQKLCTVSYDTMDISYDSDNGLWLVHFYTKNQLGGDQTVEITRNGDILSVQYGE